MKFDSIPAEMREEKNWIASENKQPRAPWVGHAKSVDPTDPANFTDFDEARRWCEMTHWIPGFQLSRTPFVAVDLDDCRDPETGAIEPWAQDIIDRLDSVAMVSPSGTGIHVYVRGELDPNLRNKSHDDGVKVELYDRDRYVRVSGDLLPDSPAEVRERQSVLDELQEEHMDPDGSTVSADGVLTPPTSNRSSTDDSGFYDLRVTDIYTLPVGENIEHPEHGSHTGANFKIHPNGETAICWHGGHSLGKGDGCGLNAQQLLAIRATGRACDDVRRNWQDDDELFFEAWKEAVERHGVDPHPVPYRVIRLMADRLGLNMQGGGAFLARETRRALRDDYGLSINPARR